MPPLHDRHPRRTDATRRAFRRPVSGAVTTLFLCVTAAPALAQTAVTSPFRFGGFAARNESAASAVFGGAALSGHSGLLGLRVSGALAGFSFTGDDRLTRAPVRSCSRFGCHSGYTNQYGSGSLFSADAWTADADVIAEPFRTAPVMRQLLLGFSPYAFAGIGRYAGTGTTDTARAIWSYGVGVHHDLVSRLAVSGEARVRRNFEDNTYIGGAMRNSVQYRLGLTVGMGGGPKRRPATPRVVWRGPASGSTPKTVPSAPPAVPSTPAPVVASSADDERAAASVVPSVLDAAESLLDTRWRDGGATPDEGFDAGGFVQYVFAHEDIPLPRLVSELAATGAAVPLRVGALRAGDLLFFANDGNTPDHVAIYVGHDRIVHATASGGAVRYDVLGDGARGTWFAEHLVSVRRILATHSGASRTPPRALSPSGRPDGAPRPSGAP